MRTLLDIFQGAGLAGATGIRPFLPAFLAGVLAAADAGIDFDGTEFAFLESPAMLIALAVLVLVTVGLEVAGRGAALTTDAAQAALAGIGIGLGALLFAGSLDDRHDVWWPGIVGGILAALVASAAARRILGRVAGRLDADARRALPVYAEGAAIALAGGAILFPPLGILGLLFLAYLYAQGRRREGEKYAGLRILK